MHPILMNWHDIIIPSWHVFFLLAVTAGFFLFLLLSQKLRAKTFTEQDLRNIFLGTYISGYFGARLWSVIVDQSELNGFWAHFKDLFMLGPLTLYGCLLAAGLFVYLYTKQKSISFLQIADAVLPACLLGIAIGRIGCFLNGCDYGIVIEETSLFPKTLAVFFPHLLPSGPRYPVQIIESFFCFLSTLVLYLNFNSLQKKYQQGTIAVLGLLSYGLLRFLDEFLRDDPRGWFIKDVLTPSQFLSLILIAMSLFFLARNKKILSQEKSQVYDLQNSSPKKEVF